MTKGKKWTLRLLGVAVLALLVSFCLMGSTMARYTSKGEGSGSLTVALWDVETAELSIEGDAVSPDDAAYGVEHEVEGQNTTTRYNVSDWCGSFTIVNKSDVDALVTFDAGSEYTIDWPDATDSTGTSIYEDHEWSWGVGWTDTNLFDGDVPLGKAQTNAYGSALMIAFGDEDTGEKTFEDVVNAYGIFTLRFGFGTAFSNGSSASEDDAKNVTEINDEYISEYGGVPVESGMSVNIYAEVVWTSIDESMQPTKPEGGADDSMLPSVFGFGTAGDEDWAGFSDAVDTILGMYAQKLTFDVSWTAVQNSTKP